MSLGLRLEMEKNTLYCTFCGKSQHEVKKLIAGPTVFICNDCVYLCVDILADNKERGLAIGLYAQKLPKEKREASARALLNMTSEVFSEITVLDFLLAAERIIAEELNVPIDAEKIEAEIQEINSQISSLFLKRAGLNKQLFTANKNVGENMTLGDVTT